MMTPAQLKNYEFKTAGRNAYKADDVDEFLAEVVINYEKMFRENSELIKRVSLLADKLESYKNDEVDIKQAVIGAQRAADMIIKEAEDSVADIKSEAEAILAAAKGEADVIKSDAEKQAIADSELVLAIATDKAEDIIAKAKEKAHGILIAANDSASNTMGQANRTITSESLHYDMLKKEVSEFRASILAQYKAHIEMISKLPELAVEEASKIENVELPQTSVEELEAEMDSQEIEEVVQDEQDSVLEFVPAEESTEEEFFELEPESEEVVKTTLPYDFFEENSSLEYVDDVQEEEPLTELDAFENTVGNEFDDVDADNAPEDIPITKKISVDIDDINESFFEDDEELSDDVAEIPSHTVVDDDEEDYIEENEEDETDDVSDFFDAIETIPFDEEDDEPKRRGFFRKKK